MTKLQQFGAGSSTARFGYNLPFLIGNLEHLCRFEKDNISSPAQKLKAKRLALVEDAVSLLNEALDMGNEDR